MNLSAGDLLILTCPTILFVCGAAPHCGANFHFTANSGDLLLFLSHLNSIYSLVLHGNSLCEIATGFLVNKHKLRIEKIS